MSQQKKQKVNITNRTLLWRLRRLPITHQLSVAEFGAYIGILLVSKGDVIDLASALRVIHKAKLHEKLKKHVPTENYLDCLIYIVIYKRELVNKFLSDESLNIWQDEITAPIFDIMKNIAEIYKV